MLHLDRTALLAPWSSPRSRSQRVADSDGGPPARTVTIYVSTDRVFSEPVLRAYEQQSGVTVNAVYDTEETKSTGLANRLLAEQSRPQADVFWSNEPVRTLVLKSRNILAPYRSPNAAGIPAALVDPEHYWTGFSARIRVIAYNTTLVTPAEAPRSVFDLADPRWRGQVAIADPRFGSTSFHVAALYVAAGDERMDAFFRQLKANDVRVVDGNSVVRDLVARGEVTVGFTDTDDVNVAIEDRQPIAMVLPDAAGLGVPVMPNMVSLIANAPHADGGSPPDRPSALARGGRATRPLRRSADSAARRSAWSEEHSGDRDVQTDDAGLHEGGAACRRRDRQTRRYPRPLIEGRAASCGELRSSRTVVIGLAGALFAVGCVLPVVSLLMTSFGSITAFALDRRQWGLLANTSRLGAGTALLAMAIGTPLGLVLARARLRPGAAAAGPRRAGAAAALRRRARVDVSREPRGLVAVTGRDLLSGWTYSLPAAVLVLGLVLYPIAMLASEVAFRRIDGRIEEAALLVASPPRVFWHIVIPLVVPSIVAAGLVIFVLAASEFGVPGVLRVRVYTTEIFTAFAALYDPRRATVLALPLVALCCAVAAIAGAAFRDRFVGGQHGAETPAALRLGRSGYVTAAVTIVLAAALAVPLALLAREALDSRSITTVLSGSGAAIGNSLRLAAIGASGVVGVAMWLGYARARTGVRVGRVADVALVVLFAMPGT